MYVVYVKSPSGEYWNQIFYSSEEDECERRGEMRLRNLPKGSEYKVLKVDDVLALSERYFPTDFEALTKPKRGRPRKSV